MLRAAVRVGVIAIASAALLFGVAYVYLGMQVLPQSALLVYVAVALVVPALAVLWPLDARAGPVLGVLLLGTVVFSFGVYGTGTSCLSQVPRNADYGVVYVDGVLRYGAHIGGLNYQCSASSVPSLVVLGYLLVAVGLVAAAFDWHLDPPWDGVEIRGGRFGS